MKIPHWVALGLIVLGGGLQALGQYAYPSAAGILTPLGHVLIGCGTAGALVLPSILTPGAP